jgi:hypothetical protein
MFSRRLSEINPLDRDVTAAGLLANQWPSLEAPHWETHYLFQID